MPFRLANLPVAALTAALFLTCPASAADKPAPDTVLARVGETEITLGHVIAIRSGLPEQYAQIPPDALFDGILNQLVQQSLLAQSAGDEPSLLARLMVENETRAILASAAISDVMESAITEEAVKAAYEARYLNAEPATEYNAAHILVATQEEAQDLIGKLEAGQEFAALAKEFSTGPSGANGGDLGWFAEGMMVAPFFDAVAALEPGEVSPPVQTDFGWHVIRLNETRAQERPELEAVRAEIEDILRNEALEAHIAELEAKADIERADTSLIDPAVISDPSILEE